MPDAHVAELLKLLPLSHAQLRQDLFVLTELGFKRCGYFVEFGAASGKELSNTWLLEKHFGWSGILAEPAKCWHERLAANRTCVIENRCVWKSTGDSLEFAEASEAEISTLTPFKGGDQHAAARRSSRHYQVETISLNDLMAEHKAPDSPDYLSIDTEGSELEILQAFDFKRHPFKVITCEHNFTPAREKSKAPYPGISNKRLSVVGAIRNLLGHLSDASRDTACALWSPNRSILDPGRMKPIRANAGDS